MSDLYACYEWVKKNGQRGGGALCVRHRQQVEVWPDFSFFYTVDFMHPLPYCDHCLNEQRSQQGAVGATVVTVR